MYGNDIVHDHPAKPVMFLPPNLIIGLDECKLGLTDKVLIDLWLSHSLYMRREGGYIDCIL